MAILKPVTSYSPPSSFGLLCILFYIANILQQFHCSTPQREKGTQALVVSAKEAENTNFFSRKTFTKVKVFKIFKMFDNSRYFWKFDTPKQ